MGLVPRLRAEETVRTVAIVADWRDIDLLSRGEGVSSARTLDFLKKKGLGGLMVGELFGEEILAGLGPATMHPVMSDTGKNQETLFTIAGNSPQASRAAELLAMRTGTQPFPLSASGDIGILWPIPMESLRKNGVIPDLDGLDAGTEANVPIFYRVAPASTWQLQQSLAVTKKVLSDYPGIAVVTPSGEVALGYPDMKPLASLLKERKVPAGMVEFSRQLGAVELDWLSFPALLPLHSVTNDELVARRIDRTVLRERLVRAATERSVRLVVLRPAVSGNVQSSVEAFGGEIETLARDLSAHGLKLEWPKVWSGPVWGMSFFSALACSMTLLLSLMRYMKRMGQDRENFEKIGPDHLGMIVFVLLSGALAAAVWKISAAARLTGALTTAFIVTEATLIALDDPLHRWQSLAKGFIFCVGGGLAVAALFSFPLYMLRLNTFSGVKLTLMLPPVLVLLHDLRRRIHPESLSELLCRPPLFGELAFVLCLAVLLGLILFRSDNVRFISGFETQIRTTLERTLLARPRNREVFIGYPCLLLYAFAVQSRLWARYREILRLGVAIGFSSVVNSFCHYHTPLFFILLREFNGLWTGILLGLMATAAVRFVVLPAWRRIRFIAE
jgi:hypothetical protein